MKHSINQIDIKLHHTSDHYPIDEDPAVYRQDKQNLINRINIDPLKRLL